MFIPSESSVPTDAATIGGGDLQKLGCKNGADKMPKQCIWLKFEISWNMLTYLDEIYDVEICLWNLWMRYNEMLPVFLDVSESDSSCLHLVQWDTNSFLNHSCSKNCTSVFMKYVYEIYDLEIGLWILWMRYNEMLPVFLDVSESDSSCLHLVQWDTNSFLNHSCSKKIAPLCTCANPSQLWPHVVWMHTDNTLW